MIGQTVSHYRIVEQIGSGGMGVVYRAEDLKLRRFVALKFLSDEHTLDKQALERFRWEAEAASALNHPHICTVHDVDEADGRPFIVMELLDGKTLREVLFEGALAPDRVAEIGLQIADALAAAHARDIIHRDLKPANIFLTSRGQAKLLDFGVAKALDEAPGAVAEHAALAETVRPLFLTDAGKVRGTAAYMAPEQVRGERIDGRTDLFALGAVLYELVTGRAAFDGRTLGLIHDAILNRTLVAPSELIPAVPLRLDAIIARCLEKDPDLRYQTAADVRADLKRSLRGTMSGTIAAAPQSRPVRRRRDRTRWTRVGAIAAAALLAAAAMSWTVLTRRSDPPPPSPRLVPFTALPGLLREPAFSPEGTQIAFAWNGGDGQTFSIYTQLFDAGTPLRLTMGAGNDTSPAWSPDGRFVAFHRQIGATEGYHVVPSLGGAERPLAPSYGVPFSHAGNIDWSPDGLQLAVADRLQRDGPVNILLVSADGGGIRPLLSAPMPYVQNPAYSGDGRSLAFVGGTGFLAHDIYVARLPGGELTRLTFDAPHIAGLAWSADDREILFSSNRGGLFAMWKVPVTGGEPQLVTAVEDAYAPTRSRRSGDLAYLRMRVDWNIWRVAGPRSGAPADPAERLIASTREEWQPAFSPDGSRIAFVSNRSGSQEVWVTSSSGAEPVQLTSFRGPPTGTPRWSPDGRRLAFDSRVGGSADIFVVGADGTPVTRLTTERSDEMVPSWSRDGRSVYFTSDRAGREQIWRIPSEGGAEQLVLDTPAIGVVESPDGRALYYWRDGAVWRRPLQGGAEVRVAAHPRWESWVVRDEGLYLLNEWPGPTIDFVDLATGQRTIVRELADWPRARFPASFDLSVDGRWFLFGRVDQIQNDIMLLQHFW